MPLLKNEAIVYLIVQEAVYQQWCYKTSEIKFKKEQIKHLNVKVMQNLLQSAYCFKDLWDNFGII